MHKLIIFDMDGVLTKAGSSWVAVHDHFGVNNEAALKLYLEHKIDDMEFMRRDIALWKAKKPNLCKKDIQAILGKVEFNPNLEYLFKEIRKRGLRAAVVSGGIDVLAQRLQRSIKCDYVAANGLLYEETGLVTGEGVLRVPVMNKDLVVKEVQRMFKMARADTISVGNSLVDAQLFKESDLGIAFNPEDDVVRKAAQVIIESDDLAMIVEYLD